MRYIVCGVWSYGSFVGPVVIIKSVDHVILEEDVSHRILEVVGHVLHEDVCHASQVIFEVVSNLIL